LDPLSTEVYFGSRRRDSQEGVTPAGCPNGHSGIVERLWCRQGTPQPSEDTPNGGTQVLAVCTPPGQLEFLVALALKQHGQQATLRKRRG
jgi:hypothetical protein